jgi:hypothetical protein
MIEDSDHQCSGFSHGSILLGYHHKYILFEKSCSNASHEKDSTSVLIVAARLLNSIISCIRRGRRRSIIFSARRQPAVSDNLF